MKLEEVIEYITEWADKEKTGFIKINFFKGGISNINVAQSITTKKECDCKNKR